VAGSGWGWRGGGAGAAGCGERGLVGDGVAAPFLYRRAPMKFPGGGLEGVVLSSLWIFTSKTQQIN
jgi:hypothetical protein